MDRETKVELGAIPLVLGVIGATFLVYAAAVGGLWAWLLAGALIVAAVAAIAVQASRARATPSAPRAARTAFAGARRPQRRARDALGRAACFSRRWARRGVRPRRHSLDPAEGHSNGPANRICISSYTGSVARVLHHLRQTAPVHTGEDGLGAWI